MSVPPNDFTGTDQLAYEHLMLILDSYALLMYHELMEDQINWKTDQVSADILTTQYLLAGQ